MLTTAGLALFTDTAPETPAFVLPIGAGACRAELPCGVSRQHLRDAFRLRSYYRSGSESGAILVPSATATATPSPPSAIRAVSAAAPDVDGPVPSWPPPLDQLPRLLGWGLAPPSTAAATSPRRLSQDLRGSIVMLDSVLQLRATGTGTAATLPLLDVAAPGGPSPVTNAQFDGDGSGSLAPLQVLGLQAESRLDCLRWVAAFNALNG